MKYRYQKKSTTHPLSTVAHKCTPNSKALLRNEKAHSKFKKITPNSKTRSIRILKKSLLIQKLTPNAKTWSDLLEFGVSFRIWGAFWNSECTPGPP